MSIDPLDPRWAADVALARQELGLEDLLRKCHRDEVLPLAEVLAVNPQGLGTGKLAQVCAWALRRAGGHELQNLVLRGGRGPSYPRVLRELAGRLGTQAQPTLERTELAIMAAWLDKARDELPPEALDRIEAFFGDPDAGTALVPAEQASLPVPSRDRKVLAASTALRFAPLLVPFFAPVTLAAGAWYIGRPKDKVLLPAVLEVARLRQVVRHRVTVGVVGSPSAGKDAAIKAIFGVDTGNVHPVAGSTKEVAIHRLAGARALFVVNTPGMGDVVEAVTEQARQILHHIDVFVYVVNTQGGVQARERADYRGCVSTGRPVLAVVNKIDTLRESDRQRYLDDARGKLGAPEDAFLAAAFDPLPQLSETPIGVEPVQAWLTHHLARLGKDPTELPWVSSELDARVEPPGAMTFSEDGEGESLPATDTWAPEEDVDQGEASGDDPTDLPEPRNLG
ncbi:MAG: 50S ribosome-binding GTPase [Alphaproteobacteria bacterium]|nr:50S ribosome-binding GTPase [Alphaproteobacteria bacterium]